MEMAQPSLGDIGLLEEGTARIDNMEEADEDIVRNINREKSNINVRDSALQNYILQC